MKLKLGKLARFYISNLRGLSPRSVLRLYQRPFFAGRPEFRGDRVPLPFEDNSLLASTHGVFMEMLFAYYAGGCRGPISAVGEINPLL